MREVYFGSRFRKDFKLIVKRGLNMSLIRKVMEKLENARGLSASKAPYFLSALSVS